MCYRRSMSKWEGVGSFFDKIKDGGSVSDWGNQRGAVCCKDKISVAIDRTEQVGEMEICFHVVYIFGGCAPTWLLRRNFGLNRVNYAKNVGGHCYDMKRKISSPSLSSLFPNVKDNFRDKILKELFVDWLTAIDQSYLFARYFGAFTCVFGSRLPLIFTYSFPFRPSSAYSPFHTLTFPFLEPDLALLSTTSKTISIASFLIPHFSTRAHIHVHNRNTFNQCSRNNG